MSAIVQITAGRSIQLSPNNGIDMLEYDDGQFYSVPDHIANVMVARGWAKLATADQAPEQDPEPMPNPNPPAPPPPPVREPDDDDGDEEAKTKRSKRR